MDNFPKKETIDGENHEKHRERLRNKLLNEQVEMSDEELVEILLFSVIPRRDVKPEAIRLIDRFKNLNGIFHADYNELVEVKGIGENTATFLRTVGKAVDISINDKGESLNFISPQNVYDYLKMYFKGKETEIFLAFFLSETGRIVARHKVSSNMQSQIKFDMNDFAHTLTEVKAHSVVITHNHPSGDIEPSVFDDNMTKKILMLCSLTGTRFDDHVIVANENVYSYRTSGRLEYIVSTFHDTEKTFILSTM